jgi:outer membrane protein assembly factor BamD (BamD/ComL family)
MFNETQPEAIHQKIRAVYNSGDCARAVQLAVEFLEQFPKHYLARYSFAVMHGDYSHSPSHSEA